MNVFNRDDAAVNERVTIEGGGALQCTLVREGKGRGGLRTLTQADTNVQRKRKGNRSNAGDLTC